VTELDPHRVTQGQAAPGGLPYRIAVLCYLFDADGRVLLLHRRLPPNRDLYSPIGGKLEITTGESPTACAIREIEEETGLAAPVEQLHLTGIVSERGYRDEAHWLMFLFEWRDAVKLAPTSFREGRLDWHDPASVSSLPIPETDRDVIWPLFWRYRGRFFCVHMDCRASPMRWRLEQPGAEARSGVGRIDEN